jgi:hypothetical protein
MKKTRIYALSEMDANYCNVGIIKIINLQFVCLKDVPLESSSTDGENVIKNGLI